MDSSDGRPVMTLRPCARRACWRMFPVVLPSARIYCDEDCVELEAAARADDVALLLLRQQHLRLVLTREER